MLECFQFFLHFSHVLDTEGKHDKEGQMLVLFQRHAGVWNCEKEGTCTQERLSELVSTFCVYLCILFVVAVVSGRPGDGPFSSFCFVLFLFFGVKANAVF